jgi:hypothetical protein
MANNIKFLYLIYKIRISRYIKGRYIKNIHIYIYIYNSFYIFNYY